LFDRAATKLAIPDDPGAKEEARQQFVERFSSALSAADGVMLNGIPDEAMKTMEDAIEQLSPAQVAGHLASIPIAHQAQQFVRALALRTAEQRMLKHIIEQADDSYGGN